MSNNPFQDTFNDYWSTLSEGDYRPGQKINWDDVLLKFNSKDGKTTFVAVTRDTKGMRGSQDKIMMYSVDKSGKVIMDYGSHSSTAGAKAFAKTKGYLAEELDESKSTLKIGDSVRISDTKVKGKITHIKWDNQDETNSKVKVDGKYWNISGVIKEDVEELDEDYVNIGGAKVKNNEKDILKHIQKTFPNVKKVKKDPQYGWVPVKEELDESLKVNDVVIANMGPHKGKKHRIIHIFDDGSMNIQPILNAMAKNSYRHGAVKAQKDQVTKVNESEELDEAKKPKKFDDVLIISKNLMGMVYDIKGNKVAVQTPSGLVSADIKDLQIMESEELDEAYKGYFLDDSPQSWAIDNKVLLSKAVSMGHKLVAIAGALTPHYVDWPLVSLNEFDKKFVRNVRLKKDEYIFRMIPRQAVHGEMPLIKINPRKGLAYFLTDRAAEEDFADFDTRGTKLSWFRYVKESDINLFNESVNEATITLKRAKNDQEVSDRLKKLKSAGINAHSSAEAMTNINVDAKDVEKAKKILGNIEESIGNLTNVSNKVLSDLYKEAKKSKDKDATAMLKDIQAEIKKRGMKESVNEDRGIAYGQANRIKTLMNKGKSLTVAMKEVLGHTDKTADNFKKVAAELKTLGIKVAINEKLSKDDDISDWIEDFVNSDAEQFEGKSKEKRIEMAKAAYYATQNESEEIDEISQDLKDRYKEKSKETIKSLEPHAKKGEYKDIAQRLIDKRKKGLEKNDK